MRVISKINLLCILALICFIGFANFYQKIKIEAAKKECITNFEIRFNLANFVFEIPRIFLPEAEYISNVDFDKKKQVCQNMGDNPITVKEIKFTHKKARIFIREDFSGDIRDSIWLVKQKIKDKGIAIEDLPIKSGFFVLDNNFFIIGNNEYSINCSKSSFFERGKLCTTHYRVYGNIVLHYRFYENDYKIEDWKKLNKKIKILLDSLKVK